MLLIIVNLVDIYPIKKFFFAMIKKENDSETETECERLY